MASEQQNAQPSQDSLALSPRTPTQSSADGMVLRSGRVTPRRGTPGSSSSKMSVSSFQGAPSDIEFQKTFGEVCAGILDTIHGIPMDFQQTPTVDAAGLEPVGGFSPTPKMCQDQFAIGSLSPFLSSKYLSPKSFLDMSGKRTGFTPHRNGPSPKMKPFPTPSPYRLRSVANSPLGLGRDFDGLGLPHDLFMDTTESKPSKRSLLADLPFGLIDDINMQGHEAKKAKKEKKQPRTKTREAPKRGEYRCGKCGFFPKKQKHNCQLEKEKQAHREAANREAERNKPATAGTATNLAPATKVSPLKVHVKQDAHPVNDVGTSAVDVKPSILGHMAFSHGNTGQMHHHQQQQHHHQYHSHHHHHHQASMGHHVAKMETADGPENIAIHQATAPNTAMFSFMSNPPAANHKMW